MTQETQITPPPKTFAQRLAHLGPGIILASSIVGSGELIATTTVGAEAGFTLLWLILIGCGIKVAAQVEIGRNTITWGRTPLESFDRVPGPRLAGRGWIYWGWAVMTLLILVQQGGLLAGVAQSLAAGIPLSPEGRAWNEAHAAITAAEVASAREGGADSEAELAELRAAAASLPEPADMTTWAVIAGLVTAGLLAVGRYGLIERFSIGLVGIFTLLTLLAPAHAPNRPGLGDHAGRTCRQPRLPAAGDQRWPLRGHHRACRGGHHRRGGERTDDLSLLVS